MRTRTGAHQGMSLRYSAFVINLDRHPERLAAFRERNAPAGVDIERFPAIEGAELGPIERAVISKTGKLTNGAIGCAASHRALWQRCVALGRPIIIFEDDAALRHDLATALPHAVASIGGLWDILLLGFNTDAPLDVRVSGKAISAPVIRAEIGRYLRYFPRAIEPPTAAVLRMALGTCGYTITPRGAAKLLSTCFPVDGRRFIIDNRLGFPFGVDVAMAIDYPAMNAFVCLPPLVISPNDKDASSTAA